MKSDDTSSGVPRRSRSARRTTRYVLLFITATLVINSLVGERGLFATLSANRRHAELTERIRNLRQENEVLRDRVRRLRDDPGAIEELARRELGLIRAGEQLFIVPDAVDR